MSQVPAPSRDPIVEELREVNRRLATLEQRLTATPSVRRIGWGVFYGLLMWVVLSFLLWVVFFLVLGVGALFLDRPAGVGTPGAL